VGAALGSTVTSWLTRPEPGDLVEPQVVEGLVTLVSRDRDAMVVGGRSFSLDSDLVAGLHEGDRVSVGFVRVEGEEEVVVFVRPVAP
jgi:hypothetical protein